MSSARTAEGRAQRRQRATDEQARTLAGALLDAAAHHDWRLPEVMAGYDRDRHPEQVPCPHACSPQAWAAATPLALLTAVGGTATS